MPHCSCKMGALAGLAGIPPQAAVDPLALVAGVPSEAGGKKRQREAGTRRDSSCGIAKDTRESLDRNPPGARSNQR
jgi:hypothetical protein